MASDDSARAGRLDVRNTSGAPTVILDGATGTISAANYPRAKFVQTYRDIRNAGAAATLGGNANRDIDTLTVNIPADGVLLLRATLQIHSFVNTVDAPLHAFLKLDDRTTATSITLVETSIGTDLDSLALINQMTEGLVVIEWAVNVTAGSRTYTTSLFNNCPVTLQYFTTTLHAVYMPGGL